MHMLGTKYDCTPDHHKAADLIGSHPEHVTPTMRDLILCIDRGVRIPSDAARLASRLIMRTASLQDARVHVDELYHRMGRLSVVAERRRLQLRELADAQQEVRRTRDSVAGLVDALEHADQQLAQERDTVRRLAARISHDADAVEIGRREMAKRERARQRRLAARRQQQRRSLRDRWSDELQAIKPRRSVTCPDDVARALRRRLGQRGHVGVVIVPGRHAPACTGEAGHWVSESGLQRVSHPSSYARAGGRPRYVTSTETIEVGRGWLRDHLGGLAAEQAALDVR
jgi:hypothetical protein